MQLDDPMLGNNELEMEPMDQEPSPLEEEARSSATAKLFGFRNPEDVEEHYQIGITPPSLQRNIKPPRHTSTQPSWTQCAKRGPSQTS